MTPPSRPSARSRSRSSPRTAGSSRTPSGRRRSCRARAGTGRARNGSRARSRAERATLRAPHALQALAAAQLAARAGSPGRRPGARWRRSRSWARDVHVRCRGSTSTRTPSSTPARLDDAGRVHREAEALAAARRHPLLAARLAHARARLALARAPAGRRHGGLRGGAGARRAAEHAVRAGADRARPRPAAAPRRQAPGGVGAAARGPRTGSPRCAALPALRRCEQELTACGLDARRHAPPRDYARLHPAGDRGRRGSSCPG